MNRTNTLGQCVDVRPGCITTQRTNKRTLLPSPRQAPVTDLRSVPRASRRRPILGLCGLVCFAVFSLLGACSDASGPTGKAGTKLAPTTGSYAITAMVHYVYDIGVGRGVYNLQWTEGDPSNGGGYGSSYYTPLSPDGAFKCSADDCGNYDNPDGIPRAIDNSCDPVLYRDQCLQPIQREDSAFLMRGVDSLWADTMAMPDSIKKMCNKLIAQFHHLRSVGHIYSGNNQVSDGYFGTHGGATIFIDGYSDASTHVDQRWLDSTRLGINPPYSRAVVASILVHEAAHSLKYEHLKPDLPVDKPEQDRNNFSTWPWIVANYDNPAGCVRYP